MESLLNKVASIQKCFPMNAAEVLRTAFLIEHLWWLLLFSSNPESPNAIGPLYFNTFPY